MIELIYPLEPAPLLKGVKPVRSVEMLPVVDQYGVVEAQASRSFCHGPQHPLHPVVHLHIIDRMGRIYLQKRSPHKKLYPNVWDSAVGGHISYGEYVPEALFREAGEEIGLVDFNPTPLDAYVWECATDHELVFVFATVGSFDLHPDNAEVAEGRWWTFDEIRTNLGRGMFTANFEHEFARFGDTLLSLL